MTPFCPIAAMAVAVEAPTELEQGRTPTMVKEEEGAADDIFNITGVPCASPAEPVVPCEGGGEETTEASIQADRLQRLGEAIHNKRAEVNMFLDRVIACIDKIRSALNLASSKVGGPVHEYV